MAEDDGDDTFSPFIRFAWDVSVDAVLQRAGRHGGPAVVVRIGAAAGFGPAIASGDTRPWALWATAAATLTIGGHQAAEPHSYGPGPGGAAKGLDFGKNPLGWSLQRCPIVPPDLAPFGRARPR